MVIAQAEGAYIYDARGQRYLDGMGGLWCVNVGHGRKQIIDAISDQLSTLDYSSTFYNMTHPIAGELAERVAALAPSHLNQVYFANSGSVANDTAVRILHYYNNRIGAPRKKKILSRLGAYHGSTHLSIAMTQPAYRVGWDCAEELVHFLSNPCAYYRSEGMSEAEYCDFLIDEMRRDIEKIGAERIACFIAEPILGAGGVIVPPEGYHQRSEQVCREYDIKTISDEVVTGFGRIGHMFASEHRFDLTPDIITCAKGITSGYQPLSATLISDEIYDVVSAKDAKFFHGMTYSGHPACCAAAMANIDIIENDGLCDHVKTIGPLFESMLKSLESMPLVGDVRGSHFMMAIEFAKQGSPRTRYDVKLEIADRIAHATQKRGLIVRPSDYMIMLSPPLILTEVQIGEVVDILRESLEEVAAQMRLEGTL